MEQLEKKIVTNEWKEIIKRGLMGISILLISLTYPLLNQNRGSTNSVFTYVDKFIPFNKYFILPYMSWYLFIAVFSVILCIVDKERYLKLLITLNIGMISCYIIYYFYPTYVPRPIIKGTDFFSNLVMNLYQMDNPYNCFPSIHVLNSVLVALYTYESDKVSKWAKAICIIISVSIILSTVLIKQHYFADVIAGIIFACILYFSFFKLKFNDMISEKNNTSISDN
ncbi:phosphatase PAP2 family protein [Clostridium psychrophilum]|uniref:phosphatase PAP2 family protein n=1 Tax=Clostridium psychrophilum TaxID=132926 RepID=UPI001C0AFB5A|nr:phosphatase PAP2 family protein [Clostridium psychrophilum]MBU3180376.1 phosphatase PAP2 family protein [Clostridium psychrophilum]